MKIKEIDKTSILCISIAVICLLYKNFYEDILYFTSPMMSLNKFFMILYQYVAFQIFLFYVLKLVGNIFKKSFNIHINLDEKKYFIILLFFYILFVILIENNILKFILILSPIRFLVYAVFAVFGFLAGVSYKS